ncbi:hypothetical protein Pyn_26595 [Prunus yedoensis var. nudiflora]|uniref:Uncharacterized protein n=1 Tax=Prunus yedoensis var. nudiflora TaxID=2094558 RepID=A0A314Z7I9_PRUYE|nr:hypothetical protein Pyn_26595 [Prunus yedoensis var. nudiflora]
MRIRQARFTGVHARNSGASEAGVVVTIDDDSDGDDATETEVSVPEQEDVGDMGDACEDSDEGDHHDYAEDAFVHSSSYPEEQGGSDAFSGLIDSSARRISIESITEVTDGLNLAAAVVDLVQSAQEVGHTTHNMEIVPMVPSFFGAFDSLIEAALAESSPTMAAASSPDRAFVSQAASPLSGVRHLPFMVHCPLHPTFNHFSGYQNRALQRLFR